MINIPRPIFALSSSVQTINVNHLEVSVNFFLFLPIGIVPLGYRLFTRILSLRKPIVFSLNYCFYYITLILTIATVLREKLKNMQNVLSYYMNTTILLSLMR